MFKHYYEIFEWDKNKKEVIERKAIVGREPLTQFLKINNSLFNLSYRQIGSTT